MRRTTWTLTSTTASARRVVGVEIEARNIARGVGHHRNRPENNTTVVTTTETMTATTTTASRHSCPRETAKKLFEIDGRIFSYSREIFPPLTKTLAVRRRTPLVSSHLFATSGTCPEALFTHLATFGVLVIFGVNLRPVNNNMLHRAKLLSFAKSVDTCLHVLRYEAAGRANFRHLIEPSPLRREDRVSGSTTIMARFQEMMAARSTAGRGGRCFTPDGRTGHLRRGRPQVDASPP